MNKVYKILAAAALAVVIGVVAANLIEQYIHEHIGTIATVELAEFLDDTLIANDSAIDWYVVEPGFTYSYNYTVKNTGTIPVNVTLTVEGLSAPWLLTWEGNNTLLAVGESAGGWMDLTVPAGATTFPTFTTKTIAEGITN